ncbi:hypothetical protein DFH07DRAFT_959759 [Mycena maculata]|uniref:Uncharacterized protein n=1 Tax=Mycena maculata TaxID=230809 RepID=A0AAD7J0I1_9AGAR|nr:hypothetical protein DFH07DRAFT_959759 [Mycena maculata]
MESHSNCSSRTSYGHSPSPEYEHDLFGIPKLYKIRGFPQSVGREDHVELVVRGPRNCTNIRVCTWTRARLGGPQGAPIAELEINGHYDTASSRAARICADYVERGPAGAAAAVDGVHGRHAAQSESDAHMQDGVLQALALSLANLEHFSIIGCRHVTHLGIWAVLSSNTVGLRMSTLAPQLYATGAGLLAHSSRRTVRVSTHRMAVGLPTIVGVCPALRQLFVVVARKALQGLAECLARARCLAAVHVKLYEDTDSEEAPGILKAPDALAIARRCLETITMLGCNARVGQVERQIRRTESGELESWSLRAEMYMGGHNLYEKISIGCSSDLEQVILKRCLSREHHRRAHLVPFCGTAETLYGRHGCARGGDIGV